MKHLMVLKFHFKLCSCIYEMCLNILEYSFSKFFNSMDVHYVKSKPVTLGTLIKKGNKH